MAIGAYGDHIPVLNDILSSIESKSKDLLVPQMVPGSPVVASRGIIKTVDAGHMSDGGTADAFKVAPGGDVPDAPELKFGNVSYFCEYRKLKALVPEESHRADLELPMPLVEAYSKNLLGTLLRNRELALLDVLENTSWGTVQNLGAGGLDAQWSDDTEDPIERLAIIEDALPMGANFLLFGAGSWREFKTHPKVRDALSISRDKAIIDEQEFMEVVGEKLGIDRVVVYKLRVSTAGPTTAVAPANLVRRFSSSVWMGQVDFGGATPSADARGNPELLVGPTALTHLVEKDVSYEEDKSISPGGRLMRVAMSYDILPVTTALGARLDNVV